MRALQKIFSILAWITEAVGGLFYPLLLILSALAVPTNENNRLVDIPGFPLVLIALGIAMAAMLAGLIVYYKKSRKVGWILILIATALFIAGAVGIRICCMPAANGAVSQKITGGDRLNSSKLMTRHGMPVLIPLWVLLGAICRRKDEDDTMYREVLDDVRGEAKTLSIDEDKP